MDRTQLAATTAGQIECGNNDIKEYYTFLKSPRVKSREAGGGPRSVMVKAMDCGIVVSKFVPQSRYYVTFEQIHILTLNNQQRLICHETKKRTNQLSFPIRLFSIISLWGKFIPLQRCSRCHHHHHVVLVARISLTLSRHFSLSFIASGTSSELHPVSSHSC